MSYSFCLKESIVPENPEKKLGGFVAETRSSDDAILKTLDGLRREIFAVVGEFSDTVDVDILPPKNIGIVSNDDIPDDKTEVARLSVLKPTNTDSATGFNLLLERSRKKTA